MFHQAAALYIEQRDEPLYFDRILRHFGNMPVSEINNAAMRKAANLLLPGMAPATVRRHLYTPVRAIINIAADDDLCPPARFKAPTGGNKRTDFMVPEQAERFLTALSTHPNPHYAAMATLFIGQGLRSSEAYALQWPDVSLDNGFAMIRDTKNGEERSINLIPRCVAALSRLPTRETDGAVFLRSNGTPFPTRKEANGGGWLRRPYKQAAQVANVPVHLASPHVLRHTWATWFHAQTKDTIRLKDEGGWKSTEWLRYTKLGNPMLGQDAIDHGWDFRPSGEKWGSELWKSA